MISYKKCQNYLEYKEFLEGYNSSFQGRFAINNVSLTVADLEGFDQVWAIYQTVSIPHSQRVHRVMLGGYILNHSPKRSLKGHDFNPLLDKLGRKNCGEITAIWKGPYCPNFNIVGWSHIFAQVCLMPHDYIFGTAYPSHSMFKVYSHTAPTLVYPGKGTEEVAIFYYKKKQFLKTCVVGVGKRAITFGQETITKGLRWKAY